MRIAVVGAGAMGTLLAHGFIRAKHQVTIIDLPVRVAQIKGAGKLIVRTPDGTESSAVPDLVTTSFRTAGKHDLVVLATKAQDLPPIAHLIAKLIGRYTTVVTIQNGIPWWYLSGMTEEVGTTSIRCLDPEGRLEKHIAPASIVGCVAYPAATMDEDGKVRHIEGLRFPVGELDGSVQERTTSLAEMIEDAGFKSRVIDDIRSELWLKAWGALSINPISALTRATMVDICTFEHTRNLTQRMMEEAQDVAEALGASFRHTIEKRIEGARAVGAHKTSMLQDVENGRELELDALMLAVIELAKLVEKPVPTIEAVYACTALLNQSLRFVPPVEQASVR